MSTSLPIEERGAKPPLSSAPAMRVLAAILITTWPCLAEPIPQSIRNIVDCAWTLGPAKCLNALSSWRAEKALTHASIQSILSDDLEQFPWKKYRNSTDEELHSQLCDETERLLRRKSLSLTMIPGYRFELLSKGNGTLNVDVYKDADSGSGRGMKKLKKTFYKIIPLLVLPGLIMSAILPFVLPALKMMTLAAGMINNMAFTGAVFTLLRNNAFNDKYQHRVIYVNEGYKNEKLAHFKHAHDELENYEESKDDFVIGDDNGGAIEEMPLNSGWIQQYYGPNAHDEYLQASGDQYKRSSKTQNIRESRT
ncbi:Uncharacterized protein OBRU01_07945 [Operophtera brumata]|uniref:Osiris 18 n=1 Tax=Operophtera brumata TaxID=104452 RepID=A0A0L7LI89_OPEBR|nr:Uncharacterized protein OBRU01_07945 [Operophtera brumata]